MAQKKRKTGVDNRPAVNIVHATLNSPYNTLIPLADAQYLRVKHPGSRLCIHVAVNSERFYALMKELVEFGIGERLRRELTDFAETIDPRWGTVLSGLEQRLAEEDIVLPEITIKKKG
jgi:hypothetical protein